MKLEERQMELVEKYERMLQEAHPTRGFEIRRVYPDTIGNLNRGCLIGLRKPYNFLRASECFDVNDDGEFTGEISDNLSVLLGSGAERYKKHEELKKVLLDLCVDEGLEVRQGVVSGKRGGFCTPVAFDPTVGLSGASCGYAYVGLVHDPGILEITDEKVVRYQELSREERAMYDKIAFEKCMESFRERK